MIKKIFIMLITAFVVTAQMSVWAENKVLDKALFDLEALGVIEKANEDEWQTDEKITRAEFVLNLVRLIELDDAADTFAGESIFYDIRKDAEYKNDVELLARLGLVNGTGENTFSPDEHLTLEQAAKILVSALGYTAAAENQGGWSAGYLAVASKIGLLDDCGASDGFTFGQMAIMMYNALDIGMMVESFSGVNSTFEIDSERTLRGELMTETEEDIVYKLKGIVTATPYSYTDLQIPSLKNDEVVIDNVIYRIGSTNAAAFLGQEIEFYAVDRDDILTLLSVQATNKNQVTEVLSGELISFDAEKINYLSDNSVEEYDCDEKCFFLYNGTSVRQDKLSGVSLKNGKMTIIDNDADNKAELVEIWDYVNVVAEEINGDVVKFKNGFLLEGQNFIHINNDDEDKKFSIFDENGNVTETKEIVTGNVLSIFMNNEKSRYTVYVSGGQVSGKISEISDDYFKLADRKIEKTNGAVYDVSVGDEVIFYLDYVGKAVFAEETVIGEEYGYILGLQRERSLSVPKIKMLQAADVSFSSEEVTDSSDIYEKDEVPVLVCANKGVEILEAADTVTIDGNKRKSSEIESFISLSKAVKYKKNNEGKINYIETLELYGGDDDVASKYNAYDKVFGGPNIYEGFAIDEKTKIIALPTDGAESDEDYNIKTIVRADDNLAGHLAQGYEYDEETKKVKLVVVTKTMKASDVLTPYLTASEPSVVLEHTEVYNDESEETDRFITLLEDGEEKTFMLEEIGSKNAVLGTIKKGDLIIYNEALNGKLSNAIKVCSLDEIQGDVLKNNGSYGYISVSGILTDIIFNTVDTLNYRLVNKVILEVNNMAYSVNFVSRQSLPAYMYHISSGSVEMASLNDAIPYYDRLFILLSDDNSPLCSVILRK